MYISKGNQVINRFDEVVATCDDAIQAAKLLNDVRYFNDVQRQYTKAARTLAKAESLPGFRYVETLDIEELEPEHARPFNHNMVR